MPPQRLHQRGIPQERADEVFAQASGSASGARARSPGPATTHARNRRRAGAGDARRARVCCARMSNVCRHRMSTLLEGAGNRARDRLPLSRLELQSRRLAARRPGDGPQQRLLQGGLPAAAHPLRGMAGLGHGDAEPARRRRSPSDCPRSQELIDDFRWRHYVETFRETHVWDTNWKILAENFMESYHLPVCHAGTIGGLSRLEEMVCPPGRRAFNYHTILKDDTLKIALAHPDNTRLKGDRRRTTFLLAVYPSLLITLTPGYFWYLSLHPRGPGQVNIVFGGGMSPDYAHSAGGARRISPRSRRCSTRSMSRIAAAPKRCFAGSARAPRSRDTSAISSGPTSTSRNIWPSAPAASRASSRKRSTNLILRDAACGGSSG